MLNNVSYIKLSNTQTSDVWINDTNTHDGQYNSNIFGSETTTQILEADHLIKQTIDFLHSQLEKRFVSLMLHDEFEPYVANETIIFFGSICEKYQSLAAIEWLTQIYNKNLNRPTILKAILYIVIYYPEVFESTGLTIALASISNQSCEVQELSIRVMENYCTRESYDALCSLAKQELWLQSYIDQVKADFKKNLCH